MENNFESCPELSRKELCAKEVEKRKRDWFEHIDLSEIDDNLKKQIKEIFEEMIDKFEKNELDEGYRFNREYRFDSLIYNYLHQLADVFKKNNLIKNELFLNLRADIWDFHKVISGLK